MGLVPADGSCWQLPRLIGLSNTLLLQYTGDTVDGNEAYRMGLCSKVVPHDELMPSAMELASRLARGATQSMSLTKYLVHRSLETGFRESLENSLVRPGDRPADPGPRGGGPCLPGKATPRSSREGDSTPWR